MENTCLAVSFSDCSCIVQELLKNDAFIVRKFQQCRLDPVNGYLGDHSSLQVTVERNSNEETFHFFVKSLPMSQPQRQLVLEINAFYKEEGFYMRFCNELRNNSIDFLDQVVPKCFFTNKEALILEDLAIKGYATLSSRSELEIHHIKLCLSALAKLHASGLVLEERKSVKLIEYFEELKQTSYCDKSSVKKAIASTKSGLQAVIDQNEDYTKATKDLLKAKVFKGEDQRKDFTKPSSKFRNTLCHGDPWINNFMFKNDACVIIDFQSYRYTPPAQDVMTFLHFVTTGSQRRHHLEELLRFYYAKLQSLLGRLGLQHLVTREEFHDSCQYFKEFALMQAVTRLQISGMSSELLSNTRNVMFEDRYEFVVNLCQTDPIFRKMNFEAMEDLRQFYEDKG